MELPVKNKEIITATGSEVVMEIGQLLTDHKGEKTIIIYIGDICSWTDYFVITTVRSQAHAAGLLRHLGEFFYKNNITQLNYRKDNEETGWILLDCGDIIVHLMEEEQRDFYELERLWFKGTIVFP